jgi:RNA 3'-phosphate cyclase
MIELDGSHGEGGGAILRQALGMSALTGKPFRIKNIRVSRSKPGLSYQHLASVNATHNICNAEVKGNKLRSLELEFSPEKIKGGRYSFDIGTAGSITLFLQSLLLPAIFSEKEFLFRVIGGTDVSFSQPIDYFTNVLVPHLRRYADISVVVNKRGYYPKGGGKVEVRIKGNGKKPSLELLDQKNLLYVKGVSNSTQDLEKARVADRQSEAAKTSLLKLKVPVSIRSEYVNSYSTGSGIVLWALFGEEEVDMMNPIILGADYLGERGLKAERVGELAANKLLEEIELGSVVDKLLADALIPFLAVTGGSIKTSEITNHTKSNIHVAEKFFDVKYKVGNNVISCSKKSL